MSNQLKLSIQQKRKALKASLEGTLARITQELATSMGDPHALQAKLAEAFKQLENCKYMYVLDAEGTQITSNITRAGEDETQVGRDRSLRPYMAGMFGKTDFRLSQAYISRRQHRPSLTAVHKIRNSEGERLGFLGVDYDLRELTQTEDIYQNNHAWQQIKGDPAIRANLFSQTRMQSIMDDNLEDVFALMTELMIEHGVFHGKFHFASNRATIWLVDDPYDYRLLSIDELLDPDTCFAFPRRSYFERATVPKEDIGTVFKQFGALRFADDTIYLRAGSLNIVNGMIGLNFSCDGSHYLPYKEFLDKGLEFWFGASKA